MIVTNFEPDPEGGQRRIVVSDLVGGIKLTDEHMWQWSESMASARKDEGGLGAQLQLNRGRWTWYDPAEAEANVGSGSTIGAEDGSGSGSGRRRTKSRTVPILAPTSPKQTSASATVFPTQSSSQKQSLTSTKFPPNGGFGKVCLGLWSYFPEEGDEGKGELMFPKGAEITEVEEVNEEWSEGVYAGEVGFFHVVFVREIR
jgi:hypothetical protein